MLKQSVFTYTHMMVRMFRKNLASTGSSPDKIQSYYYDKLSEMCVRSNGWYGSEIQGVTEEELCEIAAKTDTRMIHEICGVVMQNWKPPEELENLPDVDQRLTLSSYASRTRTVWSC